MGGRYPEPRSVHNDADAVLRQHRGGRCLKPRKRIKMKNKIRQILREETSGFNEKTLKVLYQFMNDLTKDYVWYYDTPEQPFEITPGSIWLINPNTKQWMLELEKS